MPRDNDKNNDSRGRRDRPSGGKGRSGAARGPEKKFAKRGFAGKSDGAKREGERRPYAGKPDGAKSYGKKPYSGPGKPYAGKREGPPPRRDGDAPRRDYGDAPRPRGDRPSGDRPQRFNRDDRAGGGEKRPYSPRGDRPSFNRDDVPAAMATSAPTRRAATEVIAATPVRLRVSPTGNSATRSLTRRERVMARSGPIRRAAKVWDGDRPQGDRPYSARPPRDGDRPRGDRPERKFGGDKKFSRGAPDRGPRKDFGSRPERGADRGDSKPWQKRDASSPDHAGRTRARRATARAISTSRVTTSPATGDRGGDERPRFSRPREDRPPRRSSVPRASEIRSSPRGSRRTSAPGYPRRRQLLAGASAQRVDKAIVRAATTRTTARSSQSVRRSAAAAHIASASPNSKSAPPRPPREKKSGERIAKVLSRAGLASRRDAEEWIVQGRVTVNGRVINSPALDVTENDVITVDGKPLPPRERTRLFMFHKPRGLMTTHADPEGRPTVFDNLPEGLPRLISIGRLDFNTEGLLLLTNDGGLARALELPDTGWLRRYRVRAHGEVTQGAARRAEGGRRGRRRQIRPDRCDAGARPGRQCLAGVCDPRRQEPRGAQRDGASRPRGEPADPDFLRPVPARRTRGRSGRGGQDPGAARPARREDRGTRRAPISTGRCRARRAPRPTTKTRRAARSRSSRPARAR